MKYQELSAEDKKLLNTDLGEFDKVAAAEMSLAQEMYLNGFEKLAAETADYLDTVFAKVAEEEKEEKEEKKEDEDEETKKTAEELGAFIERGFFDGLRKLGAERYGDETVYIYPYLEEKVAEGGKFKAVRELAAKAGKSITDLPGKVRGLAKHPSEGWRNMSAGEAAKHYGKKAVEPAVGYGKDIARHARQALTGEPIGKASGRPSGLVSRLSAGERTREGLKAVGKASAPVAVTGAGAFGVHKYKQSKKEED